MIKTYLIIFSLISLSINSNVLNVNKEFNVYYNKHNDKQLNVSINLGEITFSSTWYLGTSLGTSEVPGWEPRVEMKGCLKSK